MIFQESDVQYAALKSREFEELCFDLLVHLGFHSLVWRQGGADSGRDIEARFTASNALVGTFEERWFVECKLHASGVPVDQLASKIAWAEAEKPDHLVIITSSYLTNAAREWLTKRTVAVPFRTHVIEQKQLTPLLLGFNDIVEKYFIDRYSKLLNESLRKWNIHHLLPDLDTLHVLLKRLDVRRLTVSEMAFLWLTYLQLRDNLNEPTAEDDEAFRAPPFFELIKSHANTEESVLAHVANIRCWKSMDSHSLDNSDANFTVAEFFYDGVESPRLGFYCFYVQPTGEGIELLVEAGIRPEAQVRFLSSDAEKEHEKARKEFFNRRVFDKSNN